MNTVTLIGGLTRDPELRKRGETKVCDMRVAESNGRQDAPLYINVSTFGRQAETCQEYLTKGRQIAVTGQLRFREWENDDGEKRSEHTIAADRIDFLASPEPRRENGGSGGRSSGGNAGGGRDRDQSRDRGGDRGGRDRGRGRARSRI